MSLTRKFLIGTGVVFVVLVVMVGNWITQRIEDSVLIRNSEFAAYYMNSFLEPNIQSLDGAPTLSADDYAALEQVSKDAALRRHVKTIKIWLPDGTVVFSTDKSVEGSTFDASELAGPLNGEIGAYLDDLSAEENAHERSLDGPVYEVYIPLRSRRSNDIIAVGEFYESASVLRAQLSESFLSSLGVLGSVAVLILIALYVMVAAGTRTIDRQRREMGVLVDARESLASNNRTIAKDVETAKRNLFEIDRLFRRRVGLELHDGPSQLLSFVLMNLDEIAELESPSADGAKSDVRDQIEKTKRAARDALGEIRSISRSLVALQVEESPQPAVPLREAVRQFEDRTGWRVRCSNLELADDLRSDVHHGLVRVIVEAMNNAARHSGADDLAVALARSDSHLTVVVSDNGKGMPCDADMSAAAKSGRMGLPGMRHRIENLGGTLSIESEAGKSTHIRIVIPTTAQISTPG